MPFEVLWIIPCFLAHNLKILCQQCLKLILIPFFCSVRALWIGLFVTTNQTNQKQYNIYDICHPNLSCANFMVVAHLLSIYNLIPIQYENSKKICMTNPQFKLFISQIQNIILVEQCDKIDLQFIRYQIILSAVIIIIKRVQIYILKLTIIIDNEYQMTKQMRPLQLISFDANKRLQVTPEAASWLTSVSQEHHIGVITVVGKYRTGKSYILNRVLLNQNKGFQVGPTINACTKGLWVWPELIENPNDPGTRYMVMDTEGLGSLEEGQQTDTKIFLMAMLLSSFFIYNSVGSIDEKAIQSLSLIINLSKLLQKGDQRDRQTIVQCFPSLLWLVRDFALRLVDEKGSPISQHEYLENALRAQKGGSDLSLRKNSIRKELTTFFRERDCFTLIRPVDDQSKLQDMSRLKDSELRPRFLQLITELRKKIFYQAKRKTFKGKPCSPSMFIQLCQHFCEAINNGGLPEIQSNWEMICKSQSARVQKKCHTQFDDLVKLYANKDVKTINAKHMQHDFQQKINQILKFFDKNAMGDKTDKKRQMKEKMFQKLQEIKKKLSRQKNKDIEKQFEEVNEKLDQKINSNAIETIFDISEQFDKLVESAKGGLTAQSQAFVLNRAYEGFKSAAFNYFGNANQSQTHHNNLLTQKLNLYQTSLNRIQSENCKKTEEADKRQRDLRNNIYELQMKAQKAIQQLQRAKRQLCQLQERRTSQNSSIAAN